MSSIREKIRAGTPCSRADPLNHVGLPWESCSAERGRYIFRQGDPNYHLYKLEEGAIALTQLLADGRQQIAEFVLPGDLFGLVRGPVHAHSGKILHPARIRRVSITAFHDLLKNDVSTQQHLLMCMNDRLRRARDHLLTLGRRKGTERVAWFLLHMNHRWKDIANLETYIPLPMFREHIADYLGLTTETVSRAFSALSRDRIILSVPDGVRILDREKLIALLKN